MDRGMFGMYAACAVAMGTGVRSPSPPQSTTVIFGFWYEAEVLSRVIYCRAIGKEISDAPEVS